jgi:hypothetical protein
MFIGSLAAKFKAHREELLTMENYAASPEFPELWTWEERDSKKGDILNVDGTDNPVYICIVGVVSSERLYVQPHGNYTKNFSMKMANIKLQLTLKRPDNTAFAGDFDTAIEHLEAAQDAIKVGNMPAQHFIITDGKGKKNLRMSYHIFEEKVRFLLFDTSNDLRYSSIGIQRSDESESKLYFYVSFG